MSSTITLKVASRNPEKPIRGLPTRLEITDKTTVQDVKNQLAKPGGWDPERLGLFDVEKKRILRDRKQLVVMNELVMNVKEVLVKDLGAQIAWTTVYLLEYIGPIMVHLLSPIIRPYIYSSAPPLTSSQTLTIAMCVAHFIKREYETLFVHRFSLATMPVYPNLFKNVGHYWIFSGLNIAYWCYAPNANAAKSSPLINYIDIVGVLLFVYGEVSNFITHKALANLRSPGGTEKKIPKGYGFDMVTCPNYFFELVAWAGVVLVSKSSSTMLFLVFAWWQMNQWAAKKEKVLRTEFPNEYKKKKYVLIPGVQ